MHSINLQQYGISLPADTRTPIGLYMDFVGQDPGILLESAEVDGRFGRYSLIAWDFRLILQCSYGKMLCQCHDSRLEHFNKYSGQDFLPALRSILQKIILRPPQELTHLPPLTRMLAGYFDYALTGLLEPKLKDILSTDENGTTLVLPGKQILFDHLHHRCVFLALEKEATLQKQSSDKGSQKQPLLGKISTSPGQNEYCGMVEATKEAINSGQVIQVVLSTRFQAAFEGNPFLLYRRLRQTNPSPYMFFIKLPWINIIGSSPELLVRCRDNCLEARPIAGTRPRGENSEKDKHLRAELLNDPKEKAEHVMLVDLGRNDLGRIAAPGSVQVQNFMQVEKFSHVMHLTSYLQADLKPGLDALDVLQATFPAGTVTGAPKIRAMQLIAMLELLQRGPYAGAVGWLGLDKNTLNLDTGISIRTMWIKEGQIFWQAGAGIVSDSDPLKEWEECRYKAAVISQILTQNGGSDVFAY